MFFWILNLMPRSDQKSFGIFPCLCNLTVYLCVLAFAKFWLFQLSDFGLAVSSGMQDKNIKMSGTLGYVAPEYISYGTYEIFVIIKTNSLLLPTVISFILNQLVELLIIRGLFWSITAEMDKLSVLYIQYNSLACWFHSHLSMCYIYQVNYEPQYSLESVLYSILMTLNVDRCIKTVFIREKPLFHFLVGKWSSTETISLIHIGSDI